MNRITELANTLGFRGVFLLKPAPYPRYAERKTAGSLHKNGIDLCVDPVAEFPWMNALLLLLMPYQPYAETAGMSGYYLGSNRAYHARNDLCKQLNAEGIRAERISVPVRETLLRHGIGIACKNGLTAVPPFGTRFVALTLALCVSETLTAECLALSYSETYRTCPPHCTLCLEACPSGAIFPDNMQYALCVRAEMEGNMMPRETMEHMSSLLGCEICQHVCPLNAKVDVITEVSDAFDLKRLLSKDNRPALELIGKNMNSGARLQQHALIMAANQHRTDLLPEIRTFLADPRPHLVQAAEYAISVLQNDEE